ncbi:nucleolar protein 8 isoform X2 [Sphaerodactylus townsendi]|uniref:nucleolar protein 8 isoform X2 n=1 Tax=Sphaerodactylus townsendi TaxID=933632 RepID=UPI002026A841|nr:nucleolar protein 8 isoform X2 [Sphaerodactylus townsendi]
MDQNPVVKRLYVGGLDHTVSKTELQERFGKFGNVTDIEIVNRRDEGGKPTKTFAYISITLSEKEFRKCISVLNKTKWKGGTLQIELAKECFLHRLARERQEASVMKEKISCNGTSNILESMKKSGVEDFHVKAVPGTEIPDHKDWVVGKFGRVLPILHMKAQHTNKIMKYDPSKYCHNLKKLDSDLSGTVPVSELTWHLDEDASIMNKKRQGQFPVYKPPKKKVKIQDCGGLSSRELKSCSQFSSKRANVHMTELVQNHTHIAKQYKEPSMDQNFVTESCRKRSNLSESDIDTDEEIRAILTKEKGVQKMIPNIEPEDSMEVVGENFELKYSTHWSLGKAHSMEKVCNGELRSMENKSEYDSTDTDEIIAVTQTSNRKKRRKEALNGSKATKEKTGRFKKGVLSQDICSSSSDLYGSTSDKQKGGEKATPKKVNSEIVHEQSTDANKCTLESDDVYLATSESEVDEDYETMMKNCYRLDLTLEDLERLADETAESSVDDESSGDTQSKTKEFALNHVKNIPKAPTESPAPKKCISPEEILAAILKEDSADEENPKEGKSCLKVQPFRGIGSLSENGAIKKLTKSESDAHKRKARCDPQCLDCAIKNPNCNLLSLRKIKSDSHRGKRIVKTDENSGCSILNTEDSAAETSDRSVLAETKVSTNQKSFPKRAPIEISCTGSDLSDNLKNILLQSRETQLGSAATALEKQQQDNKKRLAALQEKQKEKELQKRLIQGALAHLETKSTNKQKHIVFDSDDESEAEVLEFTTKTSGKLFESSEDEPDTAEEEDDRFKIKPQFEGKAGEKLMQLQSRFGTDERFRMDARFLESDSKPEDELKKLEIDEEEELALEKKKNLEILKNVLHIDIEHPKPSKQAASAKKFKDINTLRYDPTRQDHAMFERKPETTEKESKAKKKKKREEAQKLPEVSKEIFYDVAVDLRKVLESTKRNEKPEIKPWDKHDDVKEAIPVDLEPSNKDKSNTQEETCGFTFSFFGAEERISPVKEEPYQIETIKPSKVSWQEDLRFQDSSSEDDDVPDVVEREYVKEMSPAAPRSDIRFFFFSEDDDRLKEGPKLFCRSSNLDEERDDWESRRQMLIEDCRKKHKDARRKVKVKH